MTFIVSWTKVVTDNPSDEYDDIAIKPTLEEAWQEFNKKCAEEDTVSANLLIAIKEFVR